MTPTVMVYGENKYQPEEYVGAYHTRPLNDFVCNYCDNHGYSRPSSYLDFQHQEPNDVLQAAAPVEAAPFDPMSAIHETVASIDVLRHFANSARNGRYDIRADITKQLHHKGSQEGYGRDRQALQQAAIGYADFTKRFRAPINTQGYKNETAYKNTQQFGQKSRNGHGKTYTPSKVRNGYGGQLNRQLHNGHKNNQYRSKTGYGNQQAQLSKAHGRGYG